jgi:sulfite exporter TauE/SafE
VVVGVALIIVGLLAVAGARVVAEVFELPGNDSATTRFLGFGDDVASRYRRWVTVVLVGLACVGLGVARLFY